MFGPIRIKALLGSICGLFLLMLTGPGAFAQQTFSPEEEARINEMIRTYIMENPEVVLEALQEMERKRRAVAQARQQEALSQLGDRLYRDDRSVSVGPSDPDANRPVAMVEFFDYQCGFCKRVFPSVMQAMSEDPGLKVVFIELPILGPVSTFAARAALASKQQGKYFEFHKAVMNERGGLSEDAILAIADSIGLDVERLKSDMKDPAIAEHIRDNLALARDLGIDGTPAMVVGNRLVPGAIGLEELKELIAETRAEQG